MLLWSVRMGVRSLFSLSVLVILGLSRFKRVFWSFEYLPTKVFSAIHIREASRLSFRLRRLMGRNWPFGFLWYHIFWFWFGWLFPAAIFPTHFTQEGTISWTVRSFSRTLKLKPFYSGCSSVDVNDLSVRFSTKLSGLLPWTILDCFRGLLPDVYMWSSPWHFLIWCDCQALKACRRICLRVL